MKQDGRPEPRSEVVVATSPADEKLKQAGHTEEPATIPSGRAGIGALAEASQALEALDKVLERVKASRIATTFHWHWQQWGEEFFAPALAGLGLGAMLLAVDHAAGPLAPGCSQFDRFVVGAVEHAEWNKVVLGLWLAGLSLLLAGSEFASGLRRLFVLPLLRFGHHLAMLAFGALLALAVRENPLTLSGADLGAWLSASAILLSVSAELVVADKLVGRWIKPLERFKSGRLIALTLGVVMLAVTSKGALVPPKEKEHKQKQSCVEGSGGQLEQPARKH